MNDAFGAAHRAHASTAGVAEHLPSAAGLLLEKEVTTLEGLVEDPARPLVVVLGGAKVSDKIGLIERFMDTADTILIGGAMCFSFFRAQGKATGDSLVEEEGIELARQALERAEGDSRCRLLLPLDLVLGDRFDAAAERQEIDGVDVPDGWMGLDVGRATADAYAREIERQVRFSGTGRWARSRWSRSRPARVPWPRRLHDPRARRSSAEATRRRLSRSLDWPTR